MFNTTIPLYGIMLLLALTMNVVVVLCVYKKFNFSFLEIVAALVYENVGIILGGKILTLLQNYSLYKNVDILYLGFTSYGGAIGALIALLAFKFIVRRPFKDILFIFTPSIPLMYAIGKTGCFLAGCCYGIPYAGPGHVIYNYSLVAPAGTCLFPVQIVETIAFLFIFIYMIYKIITNKFSLRTIGISFILCGFAKFVLDFLRISHVNILISSNQIISIAFIVLGIIIVLKNRK